VGVAVVITVGDIISVTVRKVRIGARWGELFVQGWHTQHVAWGEHGPQGKSRDPGAGKVGLPLAAAILNRGSPNLTGADRAGKIWVCWVNKGGAGVRVDVAADKQKKGNEETRKGGRAEKGPVVENEKKSCLPVATGQWTAKQTTKIPDDWMTETPRESCLAVSARHLKE